MIMSPTILYLLAMPALALSAAILDTASSAMGVVESQDLFVSRGDYSKLLRKKEIKKAVFDFSDSASDVVEILGDASRRETRQALSPSCSGHGTLVSVDGQPWCECVNDWVGRYCDLPCNAHGTRNNVTGQCSCDNGYSSDSRFPSRYGATQCNMVVCSFNDYNTPITIPETVYDDINIEPSCGLPSGQQYPYQQRYAVGTLRHPIQSAELPDHLIQYPSNDSRVFFLEDTFRWMTPYTRDALEKLATKVSDPLTLGFDRQWPRGGESPVLLVVSGWTQINTSSSSFDSSSLSYEGRQIGFLMVRRSIAETINDPSSLVMDNCIRNWNGVATGNPLCDGSNVSILHGDHFMRMLAGWAWLAGFNWIKHEGPRFGTSSLIAHVESATVIHGCGGRVDLAFLLDGSGSVASTGWADQLNFVKSMSGRFEIQPNGTHIAVSTFAGPRKSHFSTNPNHITIEPTTIQCSNDADCHDVSTRDIETCNTDTGLCERRIPVDCNNGEEYGTVTYANESTMSACVCPANRQCAPGSRICEPGDDCTSGCREGAFSTITNGCTLDQNGEPIPSSTCIPNRVFYDPGCASCRCNVGNGDYEWDLNHSAWTDASFDSFASASALQAAIDSGINVSCPVLNSTNWASKPDFCYPDGASHLKYGLIHQAAHIFTSPGGMRSFAEGVPRVLITLSDGKANPHFEADEWGSELRSRGIRMFSVGMSDGDNYAQQLEALASEVKDRHMFMLQNPDHLQDIVDALSFDVCEVPDVLPPGDEIDDEVDVGATEFFEWPCSEQANFVTVIVDSAIGNTQVVVGTTSNPSIYDHDAQIDQSSTTHKVIRFYNGGRRVYAAVSSTTSVAAAFTISMYLDGIFSQYLVLESWPSVSDTATAVYVPAMNPNVTGPFDFSLNAHGESAGLFQILNSSGAVGLTSSGLSTIANAVQGSQALSYEFELVARSASGNCSAGLQRVVFGLPALPPPEWNPGQVNAVRSLREYIGTCGNNPIQRCPWPRNNSLITAEPGIILTEFGLNNVVSGDEVSFSIFSGNDNGIFELLVPDRRSRRTITSSGSVSLALNSSLSSAAQQALSSGSTHQVVIQANIVGSSLVLPFLPVAIGPLLSTQMTPYFTNMPAVIEVDPGSVIPFSVANPDNLNFECRFVGSVVSVNKVGGSCELSVPANAATGYVSVQMQLFLDGIECWPGSPILSLAVGIPHTSTNSPTLPGQTSSPSLPGQGQTSSSTLPGQTVTTSSQVSVTSAPTSSSTVTSSTTTFPSIIFDPFAEGTTGTEDNDTLGAGAFVGIVIAVLFCLLLVVLLAMWIVGFGVFAAAATKSNPQHGDAIQNPTYAAAPSTTSKIVPGIYDSIDVNAISNPMYGMGSAIGPNESQYNGYLDVGAPPRPARNGSINNSTYESVDSSYPRSGSIANSTYDSVDSGSPRSGSITNATYDSTVPARVGSVSNSLYAPASSEL